MTELNGMPVLVMERIEGQTMLDAIGDNWEELPQYMSRSVEIQRDMHAVSGSGLPSMKSKLDHQILHATQISAEQKAGLIAQLEHMQSVASVCYGDVHLQNLIVNDDTATIIDWMDPTTGHPLLDACRSYVVYGSVSDVAAEMYMHEFCEHSGCTREEITRWVSVIAVARLSEKLDKTETDRLLNLTKINHRCPHDSSMEGCGT